ncbi:MAG: hypothetical protein Q8L88_09125 [Bacteroidota bacterium]|nr:hypothetical protein [Bacteroidota bacterium]
MVTPSENKSIPMSERLKEVAQLLKHADKLVKEGDLSTALEFIAKARSYDSRHLYALAYEERVRTLLNAKNLEDAKKKSAGISPAAPSEGEQKIAPMLQHLSELAITEVQHSATVAAQHEQAVELQKKEEKQRSKDDELRRSAIESKIAAFLTRANGYFEQKEFNRALDEIARAYLLDPVNEKIQLLEETIRKRQEESRREDEAERQRKTEEERQRRQELLKFQSLQIQKEKEDKLQQEEQDRKRAQEDKVQQYLLQVNELFQANKLDEALSELAFVVVIDPLNEEVLRLEQKILELQERQQQVQLEQYQRQMEERQKKREMILVTIRKHISNAETLAKQQKFTDALRTITRATVLDPLNEELQESERRILAMQEEHYRQDEESKLSLQAQIHAQQEEELLRIETTGREQVLLGETEETRVRQQNDKQKIQHFLERAKQFLSERQFEAALGEVALAFIINPFDDDVKQVEQTIVVERETFQSQERDQVQQVHDDLQKNKNTASAKIRMHLMEAERLRSIQQFSKAFNEVAKAFILDPLNEDIQEYEQQLQVEFDAFLTEEFNRKNVEEQTKMISRNLQHAAELEERGLFEESLSEITSGLSIDENNQQLLEMKDRVTAALLRWQELHREETRNLEIQKLLIIAREYLMVEKFDEAKIAVNKTLELSPEHAESLLLLSEIESVSAQAKERRIIEVRHERVAAHLAAAQTFLMSNILDKALAEILSGLVLDPTNEELQKLEQRIMVLHDAKISSSRIPSSTMSSPQNISKQEQERLIRIHIRVASEFRSQDDFVKALDEVAHGLTVDMQNPGLLQLDNDIRAEQEEHDIKAAQGLKLIYSSTKAAG